MGEKGRTLRALRSATVSWSFAALLVTVALLAVPSAAEDDGVKPSSAGPDYRGASQDQQVEMLRRLLGVPGAPPAPEPAPVEAAPPPPAADEPPAAEPPIDIPDPEPVAAPQGKETRKQAAKPSKAPAKKPAPVRRAPAKPSAKPLPATPGAVAPASPPTQEAAAPAASDDSAASGRLSVHQELAALSEKDLPPPGTVINGSNISRWSHVMNPAMQWAMHRGVSAEVIEPKAVEFEPWRIAATERYSAQVTLAPNRKSIRNYVAGLPFPSLKQDDPDLAIKVMFNYENRVNFDDLDGQDFGCITGALDQQQGLNTRRDGRFGHLRRLYYTGRMIVDPKPEIPNNEGIRYRESLFPVIEPFNNKGAGFSYIRYLDPAKQDDAWLYLPATRRVRRLSTAQRSEGVFGTDLDLDSYGGFAGNPAWFDWTLLGKKTLLAPFHAKHQPIQWCDKPGDFMFCDAWEPREFYVIAARSLIPGYNFSLRIIYVDVQSYGIPFTEVYDNDGQLWRGYVQQYKAGLRKSMPESSRTYDADTVFLGGVTVFDMQLETSSRCEFPASDSPNRNGWVYYAGDKGGPQPEDFEVSGFIREGR